MTLRKDAEEQFFDDLENIIETEKHFLETDKETYMDFLNGVSVAERLASSTDKSYVMLNGRTHPVRSGMILFGLYRQTLDNR